MVKNKKKNEWMNEMNEYPTPPPNLNATNDKNVTKKSSPFLHFQFCLAFFVYNSSHLQIIE